jgi:steroid 5-alpha reductase family enzyme
LSLPAAVLAAAVLLAAVMAVVWAIAVRIRNAGIVDVAWSANFALLAAFYAAVLPGHPPRRLLIAGMTFVWSARLAGYLYRRVMGHHPVEDGRYQRLRADWAPNADRRFFWFFQLQGVLNLLLAVPLLVACANPAPVLSPLEWAGALLWVVAVIGESAADRQLDAFRRDPANRGRTCRAGLWRYSRHPNYFFEWLVWVSYFVFALASPWGWSTICCPLLMLYFLFRVTGIPATEAQALRTRGEDYRQYQETTSPFFPWFPKASGSGNPGGSGGMESPQFREGGNRP